LVLFIFKLEKYFCPLARMKLNISRFSLCHKKFSRDGIGVRCIANRYHFYPIFVTKANIINGEEVVLRPFQERWMQSEKCDGFEVMNTNMYRDIIDGF
jgi:hypothetical protein